MNADSSRHERNDAAYSNNIGGRNAETTKRVYAQLMSSMTGAGNPRSGYGSGLDGAAGNGGVRSVGAKVAHAHVVGSLVRAGCRVCRGRGESDET